jgi:cytochrome oxidase Cu insertion factor (SCO1/SenC/PrrC family)
MSTPAPAARPRRGVLLLLALVFFAPLLLAFVLYYGSSWRPIGRTNHGALIEPARTLPLAVLPQVAPVPAATAATVGNAAASDPPAAADVLTGKWSLVYLGRGDCDAECRNTLYFMRQTHLGLANLIPRVQRVFLVTGECCDRDYLAQQQPNLITLNAEVAAGAPLLAQFPPERRASTIFVVDPRGNLMMRYDAHDDPKGLRNDLKKLLALSHIG